MNESDGSDPLRNLGKRLDQAQRRERRPLDGEPEGDLGLPQGGLAFALRVATELVAAMIVAGAIGWAIDHWFGTQPWGLIVFFFLGAAAGILNVYRAVVGSGMMGGDDTATTQRAARPERTSDRMDED